MKSNNYYYRKIAEKVTGETYLKFFTSTYYARKIVEHYKGEQYSSIKPLNKYLKDWYLLLSEEEDSATHNNIWYLRRLAKLSDNSITESQLTENQCLRIILENTDLTPSLTLTVSSSSITIDSTVTLTATVLDEESNPLSNVSVVFKEDGDGLDTITTNSSGIATYSYIPTSVGNHTVTATYGEYSDSQTITVSKHTSSINLESMINPIKYGASIDVFGVLYIDGEYATSGKTVDIYNGDTKMGSATTINNGVFRYESNPITTVGTMSIKAVFNTDDKYVGYETTPVTITVTPPSYKGIAISVDKSTLSYADSDSATITAQLVNNNNDSVPRSGVTVYLYKDGSLWDTISTDSDGKVQKTYNSTGAGDIEFGATDGTLTTVTTTVSDDLFYDSMIGSVKNNWEITSGTTVSSDSTGTTFSYNNDIRYIKLPVSESSFVMEWDYITGSGINPIGVETWNGNTWVCYGTHRDGKYLIEGTPLRPEA